MRLERVANGVEHGLDWQDAEESFSGKLRDATSDWRRPSSVVSIQW
jgi:hypothetical protein